jgi:hypothetical protein
MLHSVSKEDFNEKITFPIPHPANNEIKGERKK